MRLAGQLIVIVLPASALLLAGLAAGVAWSVNDQAAHAAGSVTQRLASEGERTSAEVAVRLDEHGRSLARVVAQVAPSFVVSDDLTTLEAMAVQLAADQDVAWAAIRDAKGRLIAAAWDGGKGVKTAEAAAKGVAAPRPVSVPIAADGQSYGQVDLLLSSARLDGEREKLASATADIGGAVRDELAELRDRVSLVVGVASCAILALLGLSFALLIRRRISVPLARLESLAGAVAAGDLSQRVAITTQDEIGNLAAALDRMAQQLDAKGRLADTIADGDLTVEVPLASDRDALGRALGRMTGSLKERISELSRLADRLAGMAQSLVEATTSLDRTMTTAGANTEAVSSAMQEFQASFREIASSTAAAVTLARQASENAHQAADGADALITAGAQVAEITVVIADVAKRTNLLALNATIEAARAGEAGRGFAVVANEVKTLANETTTSTGTINQRVERIAAETRQAKDSIAAIAAAVGRIDESQQSIAASIEEQTAVSEEVVRNLTDLSGANRKAADAGAGLSGSARELAEVADALRRLAATYRF